MRICICTPHFLRNYGSVLQAYALQKKLSEMGHCVDVLNYTPKLAANVARNKKYVSKLKRFLTLSPITALKRKKRTKRFIDFRLENIKLTDRFNTYDDVLKADLRKYDAFICGSDQIWNPKLYGGFNPIFFLQFCKDKPCISYAASLRVKSLSTEEKLRFENNIKNFSAISVRENSSVDLLKDIAPVSVEYVCDPTFLIDAEGWNELSAELNVNKKSYGVIYETKRDLILENTLLETKKVFKIPFYNISNNVDKIRGASNKAADIGPKEFLSLISGSKYVLTNSFHCVIFCLQFNVPFIAFEQEDDDRLKSLLSYFGLEERLVKNKEEAIKILHKCGTCKLSDTSEKISTFRKKSIEFIEKALGEIRI